MTPNIDDSISIRDLVLGMGIGLLGNVAADYLGELAKLSFEEFVELSWTYHLYGGVGTLAFFGIFVWLRKRLRI
jgi:hypothetical protein